MSKKPKLTLPGKVEKVIKPVHPAEPERAQIKIDTADPLYDEIRLNNELKDTEGKPARLKEGANVEVTLEAAEHGVENYDNSQSKKRA